MKLYLGSTCAHIVCLNVWKHVKKPHFGWKKNRRNGLRARFNNHDNRSILEGVFVMLWFSDNNTNNICMVFFQVINPINPIKCVSLKFQFTIPIYPITLFPLKKRFFQIPFSN